jgi:hypothetical protein
MRCGIDGCIEFTATTTGAGPGREKTAGVRGDVAVAEAGVSSFVVVAVGSNLERRGCAIAEAVLSGEELSEGNTGWGS